MKLSKAAFAKRWDVARYTAWTWLQKFQADGLVDSVPTGTRNGRIWRLTIWRRIPSTICSTNGRGS
jgi:hypothetical protein